MRKELHFKDEYEVVLKIKIASEIQRDPQGMRKLIRWIHGGTTQSMSTETKSVIKSITRLK